MTSHIWGPWIREREILEKFFKDIFDLDESDLAGRTDLISTCERCDSTRRRNEVLVHEPLHEDCDLQLVEKIMQS